MKTIALSLVIVAGIAAGCSNNSTPGSGAPAQAATPAAQPAAAAPASAAAQAPASALQTFSGPVLETMDASNYTYVRVKTDAGEVWAASGQFPVKVGDRVTVPAEMPMKDFHSPALNRTFPEIYFASRIVKEGEALPAALPPLTSSHGSSPMPPAGSGPMGGMMGGMMGGQGAKTPPVVQKTAPPEGGMSIADVWAKRTALAGKNVTVRGTVVKFNGGIMGRNWVHIQDGSGKADDGSNDLTLTGDMVVKLGDVVTLSGVVGIDKDFTAGYAYPVIVENAKLMGK